MVLDELVANINYARGRPRNLEFDREAVRGFIAPECVIHEDPALPFGGDRHGPDGFYEMMYEIKATFPGFAFELEDLITNGEDRIAFKGWLEGSGANGRFRIRVVEFWTLRDGMVIEIVPVWQNVPSILPSPSNDPISRR